MIVARRLVAFFLLAASAGFGYADLPAQQDWRSHLPGEWLATVEIDSLERLEERLPSLLKPWGLETPPIEAWLANILPGAKFDDRPWVAALVVGADGQPVPLVFLPAENFDRFCESLEADPAEDLAIATVGGFDIALQECGGWVRIGLLDNDVDANPVGTAPPNAGKQNLRLNVSSTGWEQAAEFLNTRRQGEIAAGQGRVSPWRWPQRISDILDRLALFGPLAQRLAGYDCTITIGVDWDEATDSLRATVDIPTPTPVASSVTKAPVILTNKPIFWAVSPGIVPEVAVDLFLAWTRCRPEQVEASSYPQTEWEAFADAQRTMIGRCDSASYVMHFPEEGQPVSANEVVAFTWNGSQASLGEALNATNAAWNRLLKATDSRTPSPVSTTPLNDNRGWLMTVDLFENAGLDFTPELEALFDRFYGHGGKMVRQVVSSGQQEWRIVMHPSFDDPNAASLPAPETAAFLYGEVSIHRLLAWNQMVDDIGKEEDVGRRVRPPMDPTAPARFELTGGNTLHAEAVMSQATYEAAVKYSRSKKQPVAQNN